MFNLQQSSLFAIKEFYLLEEIQTGYRKTNAPPAKSVCCEIHSLQLLGIQSEAIHPQIQYLYINWFGRDTKEGRQGVSQPASTRPVAQLRWLNWTSHAGLGWAPAGDANLSPAAPGVWQPHTSHTLIWPPAGIIKAA